MSSEVLSSQELLHAIRRVHQRVRTAVIACCERSSLEELRGEAVASAGDTTYAIDRVAEETLLEAVPEEIAVHSPLVLIGEGIPEGQMVFPPGTEESDALWRLIVDPIDGTRGLMVQKRSAWILTGAAPNRGEQTELSDIQVAVQSELPLVKQHLCDDLWAIRKKGAQAERWNRLNGNSMPLALQPSQAIDLVHGYGTVCNFFAGGRDLLGAVADQLSQQLLGQHVVGEARIFEDQYPCTGGQIYGLATGQDRFVADLRPLLAGILSERGQNLGHCCHSYDLCTKLIAEETGVVIRSIDGESVCAPLDTNTNVSWIGYANSTLCEAIHPLLQKVIHDIL